MAVARSVITVDPGGRAMLVDIQNMAGTSVTTYDGPDNGNTRTLPLSISAVTSFYLATPGDYQVSATVNGREIAGENGAKRAVTVPLVGEIRVLPTMDAAEALDSSEMGGTEIDVAERQAIYDVQAQASPTVFTEVEGLTISVPPQTGAFKVSVEIPWQLNTGTAAAGSLQALQVQLTDFTSGTDVVYATAGGSSLAGAVASRQWNGSLIVSRRFSPNAATRRFRVLARQLTATPSGWLQGILIGQNAPSGTDTYGSMLLQAVAL